MKSKLLVFYFALIIILLLRLILFYSESNTYKSGQQVNFETQILSDPKIKSGYQSLYLNIDPKYKVLVKAPITPLIFYGDKLRISGRLKEIVLKNNSTIFTIEDPKIESVSSENLINLSFVYSIRQKIIQNFRDNLDPISSSLLLGIVFGIKDNLPKNFSNQIQTTGVTHVIAASGMNVTMVSGFIFYLFSFIFKRRTAIFLSIFGIIFYTALAGFQPSIIRAAIMGIIVFTAQILGKIQYSLVTLFLTVFIMLFLFPQFLIDTGFQLSVTATLGLIYIPQIFKKFQNNFSEVFITTISAQLATLPILISNFGNYSIFSIISNALILWTVPILMILGSVAAVVGLIFQPFSKLFLFLSLPLLTYFQKIIEYFAGFGSTFNFSNIPWQFTVSYYLFFISFIILKNRRVSLD